MGGHQCDVIQVRTIRRGIQREVTRSDVRVCDIRNIAISQQRQSRISTIGFIDISINGNVPVLISTCCCTAGQNSDARPVI
ncbi:hypothetical protein, partial [Escherichia coli]|uniref:hypothetical protein n=1 Tax=Escherichia coli TaxID=562 RepID=UPI00111E392A